MTERATIMSEFVGCAGCAEQIALVFGRRCEGGHVATRYFVAGFIQGAYIGEDRLIAEQAVEELRATLCHSVRFAVLTDGEETDPAVTLLATPLTAEEQAALRAARLATQARYNGLASQRRSILGKAETEAKPSASLLNFLG